MYAYIYISNVRINISQYTHIPNCDCLDGYPGLEHRTKVRNWKWSFKSLLPRERRTWRSNFDVRKFGCWSQRWTAEKNIKPYFEWSLPRHFKAFCALVQTRSYKSHCKRFIWHMYLAYLLTFSLEFYLVYLRRFFARNTLLRSSRWRSAGEHFDPEVAVGVPWGTLRSRACSWGPAKSGGRRKEGGRQGGWHKI